MCQLEVPDLLSLFSFWRGSKISCKHCILYMYMHKHICVCVSNIIYTHIHIIYTQTYTYIQSNSISPWEKKHCKLVHGQLLGCEVYHVFLMGSSQCSAVPAFCLLIAQDMKAKICIAHGSFSSMGKWNQLKLVLYVEFYFMVTCVGWLYSLYWKLTYFPFIFYSIEYISDMTSCSRSKITGQIPVVWANRARMIGVQIQALPFISFLLRKCS